MSIAKLGNLFNSISEVEFFNNAKNHIETGATLDEIQAYYSRLFLGKESYDINKVIIFWNNLQPNKQTEVEKRQANIQTRTDQAVQERETKIQTRTDQNSMYIVTTENIFEKMSQDEFLNYTENWIENGATLDEIQTYYSRLFLGEEDYNINKVIEFWGNTHNNKRKEIDSNVK